MWDRKSAHGNVGPEEGGADLRLSGRPAEASLLLGLLPAALVGALCLSRLPPWTFLACVHAVFGACLRALRAPHHLQCASEGLPCKKGVGVGTHAACDLAAPCPDLGRGRSLPTGLQSQQTRMSALAGFLC